MKNSTFNENDFYKQLHSFGWVPYLKKSKKIGREIDERSAPNSLRKCSFPLKAFFFVGIIRLLII